MTITLMPTPETISHYWKAWCEGGNRTAYHIWARLAHYRQPLELTVPEWVKAGTTKENPSPSLQVTYPVLVRPIYKEKPCGLIMPGLLQKNNEVLPKGWPLVKA
jgi:hypothetical protein